MTADERTRVQEAARRYVREQAPMPPIAVLEHVAWVILQARSPGRQVPQRAGSLGKAGQLDAA
jgi:hypothetical protein